MKKTIEDFRTVLECSAETLRAENEEISSFLNTIAGVDALRNPSLTNGSSKQALQIAHKFVEELTDPRVCWTYMKVLVNNCEPSFVAIRDYLNARAGVLILGICCEKPEDIEQLPRWFMPLLKNPKSIPLGFREVFLSKVEKISDCLGRVHYSDELISQTCELPEIPPQGEYPHKKSGPIGDSHPHKKY